MGILDKLKPVALLLLRLGLGIIFIYHGSPKLFGHTQDYLQAYRQMGFPSYFVYIGGIVEFFGGCLLIVGLFTRIAALLLAGLMAVGLWRVYIPQAGILAVTSYEFSLAMAVSAFTLVALGAGTFSFDRVIFKGKA